MWLKILWILSLLSVLLPPIGFMMNGFSYVANRHVWIFNFLTCFVFAIEYKTLYQNKKNVLISVVLTVIYTVVLIVNKDAINLDRIAAIIILTLTLAISMLCIYKTVRRNSVRHIIMGGLVFAGIIIHIISIFVNRDGWNKFIQLDELQARYNVEYQNAYDAINDTSYYRLDWDDGRKKANTINNSKENGATYAYWSFMNPNTTEFLNSNGLLQIVQEWDGLDNRPALQAFLSCKYFVSNSDIPLEGYKYLNDGIYRNDNYVPFASVYSSYSDIESYNTLTFGQRQSAQLDRVFVSDLAISDDSEMTKIGTVKSYTLDYEVNEGVNTWNGESFIIKEPSEPVHFMFRCDPEGELMFGIYGLEYSKEDLGSGVEIVAESGSVRKSWIHNTPSNRYYFGKRDYLFNMGISREERMSLDLYFSKEGIYTVKSLSVENVPYKETLEKIWNIKERSGGVSTEIGRNSVLVKTSNDNTDNILYLSVPYSKGWSVLIDGEHRNVVNANVFGMATEISAGSHIVEFRYITPYLQEGMFLGMIGMFIYILLCFGSAKNKNCSTMNLFTGIK